MNVKQIRESNNHRNLYSKTKKILLIVLVFLGIPFIHYHFSNDFTVDAMGRDFVFKTLLIPILFVSIGIGFYFEFIEKKKRKPSKRVLIVFLYSAIASFFIVACAGQLAWLYNCEVGVQKDYLMQGQIINFQISNGIGRAATTSTLVTLYRINKNDTIVIYVPKGVHFAKGEFFSKEMKQGALGFIYSKE